MKNEPFDIKKIDLNCANENTEDFGVAFEGEKSERDLTWFWIIGISIAFPFFAIYIVPKIVTCF